MHDLNIGSTIARERRAAGLTQDDLAMHLGVTKAAVSKWELGQSMPDVALLPRIAAFFRLTLDELFDYRPQMSKEEVEKVYLELYSLFETDAEKALERVENLVADYYSCWLLVHHMGVLYLNRTAFDPERSDEFAERARVLFERVERLSDDVELARTARMMRAALLSMKGDAEGGIAVLEGMKAAKPLGIETILAGMYQQKGDLDACLKLHQETLYWGVLNIMGSISSQIALYPDDPAHLEALMRASNGMIEGFDLECTNPTMVLSFYGSSATACLHAGLRECAASYLQRFVERLETFDVRGSLGASAWILFDRIPEYVSNDSEMAEAARSQWEAVDMKGQFKLLVMGDDNWSSVADDPRFKPLLDRLEAA